MSKKKRAIKLKIMLMSIATLLQFIFPRWYSIQIAKILGIISFFTLKKHRERIYKNLTHILGPSIRQKNLNFYALRTFINYSICMADLLRAPILTKEQLLSMVQFDSENFNRVLNKEKGLVLCTAHIGNWDLAGIFMSKLGYELTAVVEPIPQGFTEAMNRYRGLGGMELISFTDKNNMDKVLEQRKILVLLADRDLTNRGFELPAFNAKRSFPKGPAAFAIKFQVPIMLGYLLLNQKPGRPYLGVIEPKINFAETGNFKQDVYNLTLIIAQRINQLIAKYPDQWFVFKADWR
jgi:KDO2-lipid IV(A) lauroyltransferase